NKSTLNSTRYSHHKRSTISEADRQAKLREMQQDAAWHETHRSTRISRDNKESLAEERNCRNHDEAKYDADHYLSKVQLSAYKNNADLSSRLNAKRHYLSENHVRDE